MVERFCNVCGRSMGAKWRGRATAPRMCEMCKTKPNAQKNRPYTRDTKMLINKWYGEYIARGFTQTKAINTIAALLNRSVNNVRKGLEG